MRKTLQNALEAYDLTDICLCGPKGRRSVAQKEILAVRGAIQAAGHDAEVVVARIRQMGGGIFSGFVLDPELGHYGACVPTDLIVLATEGLSQAAQ